MQGWEIPNPTSVCVQNTDLLDVALLGLSALSTAGNKREP